MINDIINKDGKIPSCAKTVEEHNVIENINRHLEDARNSGVQVVHVKVGFNSNYSELPKSSPVFGNINKLEAFKLNTWGTEFHKDIDIQPEDKTVIKHRISAFYCTDLETVLRANSIDTLYLAGVSTNMAVELTAREAHDRDYKVVILSNACASQTDELHEISLKIMSRFAEVR